MMQLPAAPEPDMRIVTVDALPPTPWKNGGGITRDIARAEDAAGLLWLLSLADVAAAGPFSHFPGLARILTVVSGEGLVLCGVPAGELRVAPERPVAFSGEAAVDCLLPAGPVRAFNLIYDPARIAPRVAVVRGPRDLALPAGNWAAHVLAGAVEAGGVPLPPGAAALGEGRAATLRLGRGARLLHVALDPR
jgi:environmental stress-induced protein Ves